MKIDLANGQKGERVARRAFWLAWQACGGPIGMGVLQDKSGATEEQVWTNVIEAGDYAGHLRAKEPGRAYGDYVFGRMMKLTIDYGDNWVKVREFDPHISYQSWCKRYRTYEALINAAIASLAGEQDGDGKDGE